MPNKNSRIEPPLVTLESCSIVLDDETKLDDVNFSLRRGERWALQGPNGSGKSLFLKLIRGDMWPTPTGKERRKYRFGRDHGEQPMGFKERFAYVGPERQDRYVRYDWNHSVEQIVATGLFDEDIPRTQPTRAQKQFIATLLKKFKVWSLRSRGFLTLSYGQRRRTLMARAFAGRPDVLLLDEVFNGLDTLSASVLHAALSVKSGVGQTWILTTHREQDIPASVTRRAKIQEGKLMVLPSTSPSRVDRAPSLIKSKASKPVRHVSPAPLGRERKTKLRSEALVRLSNVDLYRDYRLVLKGVDLEIRRGEQWAIFGANGSGKSTLLKMLYGDLHPRLGGVIERDRVPFGTPIAEWKRRVGYVSPELQADYFLARDLEEVVISGRYSSVGLNEEATRADRSEAKKWLTFFGLEAIAHRAPRAVSYGQMRRALLARAMINRPELLLLDEPCTGLDVDAREEILRLLDLLAKRGTQLVMAVHEQSDLPACVNRVLTIERNRTVRIREVARSRGREIVRKH